MSSRFGKVVLDIFHSFQDNQIEFKDWIFYIYVQKIKKPLI